MARLTIDTGTLGNTATGDSLRGAFTKVNTNFTEIYNELGSSGILSDLSFAGNTISTDGTNQNLILDPNGTGKVIIEGTVDLGGLSIASQTITGLTTNSNITLSPGGHRRSGRGHITDHKCFGSLIRTGRRHQELRGHTAGQLGPQLHLRG
jgi:hypothetical protein